MVSYKTAVRRTQDARELVRRAGEAFRRVSTLGAEAERQNNSALAEDAISAGRNVDLQGRMPRGETAAREAFFEEIERARGLDDRHEAAHLIAAGGALDALRGRIDVPGAREYALISVGILLWGTIRSVLSAESILRSAAGQWSPEDSRTWFPMLRHVEVEGQAVLELIELVEG